MNLHSSRSARIKHMRALTRRRYKLRPWSRRKRRFLSPSPFSANPRTPRAEKVRHPRILHPDLRQLENLQWKMVLDQPRHWRPDGARLSHQGLGDGFCGSGESPVRLPPPPPCQEQQPAPKPRKSFRLPEEAASPFSIFCLSIHSLLPQNYIFLRSFLHFTLALTICFLYLLTVLGNSLRHSL